MDKKTEQYLFQYADLTPRRLEALEQAAAGRLEKMNGAMRYAMEPMIDRDYVITAYGRQVLERAKRIEGGLWAPRKMAAVDMLPVTMAKRMRESTTAPWLRSAHAKLARAVYMDRGQAYGWLRAIFGTDTIRDLLRLEMLCGEMVIGYPIELTELGEAVMVAVGVVPLLASPDGEEQNKGCGLQRGGL